MQGTAPGWASAMPGADMYCALCRAESVIALHALCFRTPWNLSRRTGLVYNANFIGEVLMHDQALTGLSLPF